MSEHPRGVRFLPPSRNRADYRLVLEHGKTAGRRRGVECQDEHGGDYRAIGVPNPRKTRFLKIPYPMNSWELLDVLPSCA